MSSCCKRSFRARSARGRLPRGLRREAERCLFVCAGLCVCRRWSLWSHQSKKRDNFAPVDQFLKSAKTGEPTYASATTLCAHSAARMRTCTHACTCALMHARSIVFNRHAHPCDAVCCHSRWACGCSVVVLQVESEQALGPNTQLLCKSLVASVRVGVPVAARLLLVSWLLAALLTGELPGPRAGADLRLAGGMYGCPAWAATSY